MFHKSNLGFFAGHVPCDRSGFIPEDGDAVEDMAFDGDWCEESWSDFVRDVVEQTARAEKNLEDWRSGQ